MQPRWPAARITHPLAATQVIENGHAEAESAPADVADRPTESLPAIKRDQPEPRPAARPTPPRALPDRDDPELVRIREILVGPHLRDHEQRLRAVEQMASRPQAGQDTATWRESIEQQIAAEREASEARDRTNALAVAQQAEQLERERTERAEHLHALRGARTELEAVRQEHQALRAEMGRERQERQEFTDLHARAVAELARSHEQERDAHVRVHMRQSTELDARLERERQGHAAALQRVEVEHQERLRAMEADFTGRLAQIDHGHAEQRQGQDDSGYADKLIQIESAYAARIDGLKQLIGEAERALDAMQAERQYLAGLLAELGLHLVRHAASPAAAWAGETSDRLRDSLLESEIEPGT
jgi:hypothetical protein